MISPSPRVLELKDKINTDTQNHVTYIGTWREEEIWVGGTSMLFYFIREGLM